MAVSRRVGLAVGGAVVGAGLLSTLVLTPALAGSASAAVTAAGGCTATAHVDAAWGSGSSGGEILSVTVVNTADRGATKWTVSWPLGPGQQVVSAWNATVNLSGGVLNAVNMPYNGTLAPGASTTFGMQLSGTGAAPTPSCVNDVMPASSPPVSQSVTPTGSTINVGPGDNGGTFTMLVGQTLTVSLPNYYDPTKVSGNSLALVSSTGGFPTGQPLVAVYRAVAGGLVDVSSQTDATCLHTSPPCAIPVALWIVHVKVIGAPASGGQTVTVTQADNGKTIGLHVGDELVLNLSSAYGGYTPPTLSASGVLVLGEINGGYPTGLPLVAHYLAAGAGATDVSSYTDTACNHAPTPCPSPPVLFTIHVVVTA